MKTNKFYIFRHINCPFYTLRVHTEADGKTCDTYVKNLASTKAESIKLARLYVKSYSAIAGDLFKVEFISSTNILLYDNPIEELLKPYQKDQLTLISSGCIPFGALQDSLIIDAPSDYLIWCCENAPLNPNNILLKNLASAALAVLIERGEIKSNIDLEKYSRTKKENRIEKEKSSKYYGMLKQRLELTASIVVSQSKFDEVYQTRKYFYKMLSDDNIIIYSGTTPLGETGDSVKLKATIKKHDLYRGCKTTHISCPKLINV